MEIKLGRRRARLLEEMVTSGRYASADDAVGQALELLASRERLCSERVELLRRAIAEGLHQASRGELLPAEDVFAECRRLVAALAEADG